MKTQEVQVIMLPTEKASKLGFAGNSLSFSDCEGNKTSFYIPQHLYFISNDTIKDNDIVLEHNSGAGNPYYRLFKKGHLETILIHHTKQPFTKYWIKKVIATTNPDLWCKGLKKYGSSCSKNNNCAFPNCDIPKIPIEFVEAYVKEQGKIDKVLLEYEKRIELSGVINILVLKLKSNGSVIVHPVKEKMYSRQEILTKISYLKKVSIMTVGIIEAVWLKDLIEIFE